MRSLLQACLVLILSVSWLPQCHAEYQNLAEAICYFGDSALIRRVWSNANNEAISAELNALSPKLLLQAFSLCRPN
jgi:hypothetical protein